MIDVFIRLDHQLFFALNNGGTPFWDALFTLISALGDAGVLAAGGLIYIFLAEKEKRKARLIAFVVSMVVAGAGVAALKEVSGRERPLKRFEQEIEKGSVTIRAPYHQLYHGSFPSGHSQAAFTAATFFVLYYLRGRWVALWLLTGASLVALSRVFVGVHYPADIVAGSLFGAAVAWLVFALDPARERSLQNAEPHTQEKEP